MFYAKFTLVFGLILGFTHRTVGQVNKLHVLVLYESLCPDSERFFKYQLDPTYESVEDHITVELVPFGKARSENGGANFYCQHGPRECRGNRMQSCVLHQTHDQDTQVKFVVCQISARDKGSIKKCADSVNISSDIDSCMNTELGTHLQLEAENITKTFDPKFIPTIVYEGVFDQDLQDRSQSNFREVLCELLQQRGVLAVACA